MNWNISFVRKAVYAGLILLLLVPLFQLGQPATYDRNGRQLSGGRLAAMRSEHNLAQASLGEIDPASESMKLATLGMRGVAANILWDRANEFEKKEDWDALSATLNQITKLQPNFIAVWEHQGHNLAYNVSVEFDDYRHRYHWVKKGIDFLIRGTEYNREEARLYHTVGWFFGHKLARSDERLQFRRLFRQDRDYHAQLRDNNYVDMESPDVRSRHDQLPDNWLVARQWFIRGESVLANGDRPLRGKSPLIFHQDKPKALINSAQDAEEEGRFGEVAREAWSDALKDWLAFGDKPIPSSWGMNLQLNDYRRVNEEVNRLREQLYSLTPEAKKQLEAEKRASLTDDERRLVDADEREIMNAFGPGEMEARIRAQSKLRVSDQEIVDRAPSEAKDKARRIGRKLAASSTLLSRLKRYRDQVNFDYWQTRCEAEQTPEATSARQFLYEAQDLYRKTKLEEAKASYEKAWALWAGIMQQYPALRDDLSSDTLSAGMTGYLETLAQLGEDLPSDFHQQWSFLIDADRQPDRSLGFDYPDRVEPQPDQPLSPTVVPNQVQP